MLTLIGIINLLIRIFIFPQIILRLGDEKTLIFGYAVILAAFTWLTFMRNVWEFVVISILVTLGTTCSVDLMNGIMSKEVHQKDMGEMIGLNASVESVSLVLAPIIGSYLISLPNNAYFGAVAAGTSLLPILISMIPRHKEGKPAA